MKYIKTHDYQKLELNDGTYLFLLERNVMQYKSGLTQEEYARNVWLMSAEGKVLWRIKSEWDYRGLPFLYLFMQEDPTLIDRWDSNCYKVDLKTGWAEPEYFHK